MKFAYTERTVVLRSAPGYSPRWFQRVGGLGPGGDPEPGEQVVRVRADGAVRQEQLLADLPVGQPTGGELGDLQFLGVNWGPPSRRSVNVLSGADTAEYCRTPWRT
jgi:hypothetical protein